MFSAENMILSRTLYGKMLITQTFKGHIVFASVKLNIPITFIQDICFVNLCRPRKSIQQKIMKIDFVIKYKLSNKIYISILNR